MGNFNASNGRANNCPMCSQSEENCPAQAQRASGVNRENAANMARHPKSP